MYLTLQPMVSQKSPEAFTPACENAPQIGASLLSRPGQAREFYDKILELAGTVEQESFSG